MNCKALVLAGLSALVSISEATEREVAPPYHATDDRYKADILLIVAHPDDETAGIAAYLARAIFDENRRVAVVYTTRGDGGDSSVSDHRATALGAEREIEGRRALASLGICNAWFLDARDTSSHEVLSALEHWNHGSILWQVVRLVRLTRPEVVITWLPNAVAGENHADHQAAAVIATEAFDLAGDLTAFPEQVFAPHDDMDVRTEGLQPWQPQKIYYYSDAFDARGYWWSSLPQAPSFRKNFLEGAGPAYAATDVSPSQHVSYARLAAQETAFYVSQAGGIGNRALETNNLHAFEYPTRLILGKSLVGGEVTDDIFRGVIPNGIPFVRSHGFEKYAENRISLRFGGSWEFYAQFWRVHDVGRLAELLPVPETTARAGNQLHVPLMLQNVTTSPQQISVTSTLPKGWTDRTKHFVYPVDAGESYPVQAVLEIPTTEKEGWKEISWSAVNAGSQVGKIAMQVLVVTKPMSQ